MMPDSGKVDKRDETETKTMSGRSQGQSYIAGQGEERVLNKVVRCARGSQRLNQPPDDGNK
jgi:hypothetical protein